MIDLRTCTRTYWLTCCLGLYLKQFESLLWENRRNFIFLLCNTRGQWTINMNNPLASTSSIKQTAEGLVISLWFCFPLLFYTNTSVPIDVPEAKALLPVLGRAVVRKFCVPGPSKPHHRAAQQGQAQQLQQHWGNPLTGHSLHCHTHISSRRITTKHHFKWCSSATEGYKSFFQVRQWLPQALLMGTVWANSAFCWQPQGLSPWCWEEDEGTSQKPVQALAGSWQLTFLPRPTHTRVYSICCLWLFWLFFSP